MRTPRPAALTIVIGLLIFVVALPAGVGLAAYRHDHNRLDRLPGHTLVGGVNVSGLDRATAVARVRAAIDAQLDHTATITVGDNEYAVTPRELGVQDDAEAAVDEALGQSRRGSWLSRTWHRIFGGGPSTTADVALTEPAKQKMKAIVRRAARENAVPAVDASAAVSGSGLRFTKAKPGRALNKKAAMHALEASLRDGQPREVPMKTVQPKVPDSAFDTVILVHPNENKLYLYKNHKIAVTYPVATGQSAYPTPNGHFTVVLKRYMPTWVNPHPNDSWGAGLPASIAPGPANPLGLRALNISAPGIRIHGTPSDYSIGYNASHGCIRMHNSDVVKLYPQVRTGTSVFIATMGTYHPLYTAPAPTSSTDDKNKGKNEKKKSSKPAGNDVPDAEGG